MPDPTAEPRPDTTAAQAFINSNPQAWLAAIVESSDDAIIGKTLDSVIRSWNAGATRVFGYRADEIIGKPIYLLIPAELSHEEPEIIARLSRGERIDHYETVRLRKDGARIDVSISVSPIRDASGTIVGAAKLARDITEAKRLQKAEREMAEQLQELTVELEQQIDEGAALQVELEETNDQLAKSLTEAQDARRAAEEANVAKSQFLATMSHELRTPLNAIAGYVDLLEMGVRGPLTPEQQQDVQRIKHSEQTLLRLIEDVLNFAKLESGRLQYHYEDVRMNEFLTTLANFIEPRLQKKGLRYDLARCAEEAMVSMDQSKVEQIMLNLLTNAVKFTEAGHVRVRCELDETIVRLHVEDTGRGIEPDQLEAIFEPFVQGDSSLTRTAEGTGLGLSISRSLARAMGGDITVTSTVGRGSEFTLTLPRHGRPATEE
jgi:PAS domain S-box-containing protein